MTKLSDIFEVLYESDLMPVADGEVIILPNVALSKIVDLTSKLGALDSGLEPMGYNRYQLILPDEIDMEVEDEEIPEDSEDTEEVVDSEEDKSEEKEEATEKDSEEKEEKEESKEESKEDEKSEKMAEEICDLISEWIGAEPVNESVEEEHPEDCDCEECQAKREESEEDVEDLSEVIDQMSECNSKPSHSFKKNELASYLECFAGPREMYEAQEDEYEEVPEEKSEEKPAEKKGISSYLTAEAEDVIDITEPAERQGLIDLLVHNKEVLWGPTSSKIAQLRTELESLEPVELEKRANDMFPEWRKHVKKYIVEPEPVAEPVEDEAPVEEIPEEVPEAAEEFQPDLKPDEQVLTEEPSEEDEEFDSTEQLVRDCLNQYGDSTKETFEPAIEIITKWYKNEGGIDPEMSLEDLRKDIEELINAASDAEEIRIVGDALGLDSDILPSPVEDEEVDENVRLGPGMGATEDFINNLEIAPALGRAADKAGSNIAQKAQQNKADNAD